MAMEGKTLESLDTQNSTVPGAIPSQNGTKPVRDQAEPPRKISRRSVKPRLLPFRGIVLGVNRGHMAGYASC